MQTIKTTIELKGGKKGEQVYKETGKIEVDLQWWRKTLKPIAIKRIRHMSKTEPRLNKELRDPKMGFFKEAMNVPEVREMNCNRFVPGVFRGLKAIGDDLGTKAQDIAVEQAFSTLDTEKVLAELWNGAVKLEQDLKDLMAKNLGVAKKVMDQPKAPEGMDLKTFSLAIFPVFETVHSFTNYEGKSGEEAMFAKDEVLKVFFSECDIEYIMKHTWDGVGLMNHEAAKLITKDTCKTCYGNWLDPAKVKEHLGYDMATPDLPSCICAHETIEKSFAVGQAHVVNNGNGTATLQTWSGRCGCYFHKLYDIITPHANHCLCSEQSLAGFYTNLLGGKPVTLSVLESYARGSKDMCSFIVQLPDGMDNDEIEDLLVLPS
jgi:hypothetical protein